MFRVDFVYKGEPTRSHITTTRCVQPSNTLTIGWRLTFHRRFISTAPNQNYYHVQCQTGAATTYLSSVYLKEHYSFTNSSLRCAQAFWSWTILWNSNSTFYLYWVNIVMNRRTSLEYCLRISHKTPQCYYHETDFSTEKKHEIINCWP